MPLETAARLTSRRRTLALAIMLYPQFTAVAHATALTLLTHLLPPYTTGTEAAPAGLAVELVQEILKRTGDTGEIHFVPYPRLLRDVQRGPVTVGFIVARTPAREPVMQWVGPILIDGVYLYRKAGSAGAVETLADARKLTRIGVTRGGIDNDFLAQRGFANLDLSESQMTDLRKLYLGRIDATPMGSVVFAQLAREAGLQPGDFERTPIRLYASEVYVALSRDVPDAIVKSWSRALADLRSSGAYAKLLARYNVVTEEGADVEAPGR